MTKSGNRLPGLVFLLAAAVVCVFLYTAAHRVFYRSAYPRRYEEIVFAESIKNGLPPSLVFAVIRTESGFIPSSQSSVGARGLMQITEETLDWTTYRLGEEKQDFAILFEGETNIRYGAALIRILLDEFGSLENALCAYHAGYGNVERWLKNPDYAPDGKNVTNIPFGDTGRYVKKVLETQRIYRQLYGADDSDFQKK